MADPLNIPDEAVKFILFQRTGYLRFPITPLYRHVLRHLPVSLPLYNLVIAVESRFGRARIKALYDADMQNEYNSIKHVLPDSCSSVLDIGCGVAGIDVFINRHYSEQAPDFYLLDKSRVEKSVFYMFHEQAAFYNSLDVARETLHANGISPECIHLLEANDRNEISMDVPVDLVLSLISWGFHYPVDIYVERVHELLSENGVVILDVRKGTDGIDVLWRVFGQVDVILETEKQYRVMAKM